MACETSNSLRILLAEDEEPLRILLTKILTFQGHYQVVATCDGLEALERLATESFDLVITDIQMPRMTGNELATEMLARGIQIPTLMISGYNPEGQVPSHASFLAKPFSSGELLERVRALCPQTSQGLKQN